MATGVIRQGNHRFENLFFSGMAVQILGTVFLGFARSYYLAGVFKAPLPNLIVHIHGAVFSSWILLLIAQTALVAAGRVDLHRRLGLLGFALACLVVILGLLAATDSLGRHFAAGEPGVGAKAFYAIPIADMVVFSTLVYFAFRERFSPAAHKRLILIATIALLDAAFVRWPIPAAWWDLQTAQMCCYPLLLLLMGYDLWSTGNIQRATLWASGFLIVLQQEFRSGEPSPGRVSPRGCRMSPVLSSESQNKWGLIASASEMACSYSEPGKRLERFEG